MAESYFPLSQKGGCPMEIPHFLSEQYPFHDIQMTVCGQADCPPGHSFGPHMRDFYLLHFVTRGCGTFIVKEKEYCLREGEFFFIEPGVLTFYQADKENPERNTGHTCANPVSCTYKRFRFLKYGGIYLSFLE